MSQERVQAILGGYEAFNRGAPDESEWNLSADFEFIPPPILPDVDVARGPEGFMAFLQTWSETFADFRFEVEEALDAGDHVLVMAAMRGTGRDSGVDVSTPSFAHVWSFRGQEIVRMEAMPNRATAVEKLGL
jgi:ketosteroid isomerase-like protein